MSSLKKKIGLIVNPIAGMGGSVGLKGTDGEAYEAALDLGAKPVAPNRMETFLSHLNKRDEFIFLTAPGIMGEVLLDMMGFDYKVVGTISEKTTAEDTIAIAHLMEREGIVLLVFCGGDGTARDIYNALGLNIPVVAIPSGVKMFSSIFAYNPQAAAQIIEIFLDGLIDYEEREVLDIDENSYRDGILDSKLYGYLKVPKIMNLIQSAKISSGMGNTIEQNKFDIAQDIVENLVEGTLYLLGPGTTVKGITDFIELPKTLLGVDAVVDRKIIATDINEQGILDLLNRYDSRKIIVTPIGGQGFLFGRGNKQFTSKVIELVGVENIIIISTEEKARSLQALRVDTGNSEVDNLFKGFVRVLIGYKQILVKPVE